MANINKAIEHVLKLEGGFVDDPDDPGGRTKFGISQRQYPALDIKSLTRAEAREIYREDYATPLLLDRIHSTDVATELLEQSVNFGQVRAVAFAQLALNMIARPVGIDGLIGRETIRALNTLRSEDRMRWLKTANGIQFAYYMFITGWLDRIVDWFRASAGALSKKYLRGWLKRIAHHFKPERDLPEYNVPR